MLLKGLCGNQAFKDRERGGGGEGEGGRHTHTKNPTLVYLHPNKQKSQAGSRGANLKSYGHESPADRQLPSDPEGKLQYEHNNMMPTGDQVRHSSADDT